jgi:hypothetical protein
MDVLRSGDEPLGVAIERLFDAPRLDVTWQERRAPPHPAWVAPPLSDAEVLLVRATRRYAAAIGGRWSVVVVESLPTRTWERMLRSAARSDARPA